MCLKCFFYAVLITCLITFSFLPVSAEEKSEIQRIVKKVNYTDEKLLNVELSFGGGGISFEKGKDKFLFQGDFTYKHKASKPTIDYKKQNGNGFLSLSMEDNDNHISIKRDKIVFLSKNGDMDSEWHLKFTDTIPISFDIDIGASKCDLNLTDLRVKNLNLKIGASSANLNFDNENQEKLSHIDISGGVSDFKCSGLGNANFEKMSFSGGVGQFIIDFRGELQHNASAVVSVAVGRLTILVPQNIGVKVISRPSLLSSLSIDSGFKKMGDSYVNPAYGKTKRELTIEIEKVIGDVMIKTCE